MTRFRRFLSPSFALLAGALLAGTASAQIETRVSRINAAQEVPPTNSPARGIGVYVIDSTTNTVSWMITLAGLTSAETAAHIHGFAPPGVNAGVKIGLALGSPKCGSMVVPAADVPNYNAGLSYANIHTTIFPGGEIRGQIDEVPVHGNLCAGDGTGTACPCGNNSIVGYDEGCLHSGGTGARLRGYGSSVLGADQVILHVSRTTNSTQLLFQGTAPIAGGAPFGDGLRCARGNVIRIGVGNACNGQYFWPQLGSPPISSSGAVGAAGQRFYQVWYRNAAVFCTPSTFNLSNVVRINWT